MSQEKSGELSQNGHRLVSYSAATFMEQAAVSFKKLKPIAGYWWQRLFVHGSRVLQIKNNIYFPFSSWILLDPGGKIWLLCC